jgi:hypothetical protein
VPNARRERAARSLAFPSAGSPRRGGLPCQPETDRLSITIRTERAVVVHVQQGVENLVGIDAFGQRAAVPGEGVCQLPVP